MSDLDSPEVVKAPKVEQSTPLDVEFNKARRVGVGLLNITKEMTEQRYSFSPDGSKFSPEFIAQVRPPSPDDQITEELVRNARRGSFGIALETARQLREGDYIRTGKLQDRLDTLEHLGGAVQEGVNLSKVVNNQDREGYMSIAREILARQLKIKPKEVQMTESQIEQWVEENFRHAYVFLGRKIDAMKAYFGRN